MGIRQQRRTHIDTIDFQEAMLAFLHDKIYGESPYIETKGEKSNYFKLVSNCLLGQGPISRMVPLMFVEGNVIPIGSDVHHLALQLMNIQSEKVALTFRSKEYIINIRDLWKRLEYYFLILFPRAQTEALHMSKEEWKYRKTTGGYDFNPEEKL